MPNDHLLPTPDKILVECQRAFPHLKWQIDHSTISQIYCSAETKRFAIEVRVMREIGAMATFVDLKRGDLFQSQNKRQTSVKQALVQLKAKVEKWRDEINEILGEAS